MSKPLIHDTDPSSTYNSLKSSVILLKTASDVVNMPPPAPPVLGPVRPFPKALAANLDETGSTSSSVRINDRFAKYMAFTQILLNVAEFDDRGYCKSIEPGRLSEQLEECLEDSRTASELARNIGDSFEAYVEHARSGNSYISKAIDLPYMTQTLLTYEIQLNIHAAPIGTNLAQQKKSFTALSLLPPPTSDLDAYNEFIESSKD